MQDNTQVVNSSPIDSISTETQPSTVSEPSSHAEPSYELKSDSVPDDDVPEWGKKDPIKFIQYRLGRQKDKFNKEFNDVKRQLAETQQLLQRNNQPQQQTNQYEDSANSLGNGQAIVDPLTGEYVAPGSVRAEVILREQQRAYIDKVQYESSIRAEQERVQNEETERFLEKLEDAKQKYSDYDKVVNSVEITQSIL